jgi:hypothetical protein
MSSHHFVKEDQEPALFILKAFSFDQAAPLLEWSPLVIVADEMVDEVLRWGIKIDVVLQHDYALENLEELLMDQLPVQIIPCEATPTLAKGLDLLRQRNYRAVNILTEVSPNFFRQAEKFSQTLQLVVFCENEKYALIMSGKFEKWLEEGIELKIFQLDDRPLQVNGLEIKDNAFAVNHSKLVSVESKSPFWVGELL